MHCDRTANCRQARLLLTILTALTTACAIWGFWLALNERHATMPWTGILLVLFVMLFFWIAFSFWSATAGFFRQLRAGPSVPSPPAAAPAGTSIPIRTAILMPIYNESPQSVFAGVRAVYESLQATGHGAAFDFYVLSDTTDPDLWLVEETTWARLRQALPGSSGIYYRHRSKNVARKSGNIADFCRQWGGDYEYMVVLDADSVMSGETLVELVRRMQHDPELGILQAPPVPVNRRSLFARCQQFAAAIYGPIFLEGFVWWSGNDGNYWGHNAIIRLDAFVRACGLPKLPGDGPLGGEILSHDFVEAALIRRAGYKVCVAADLEGSYEECPPTLIDFAQRDQRWCQGNLQHLQLMFRSGIHPVSSLHFGMGAMAYLASPLWLLSLVFSFVAAAMPHTIDPNQAGTAAAHQAHWALGLFIATMLLLLLPKLWAYLALLRDPVRLAACGGGGRVAASVAIETLISILVAPVMMAFHSTFVVMTLLGRRVRWVAQQRSESGQQFLSAASAHWRQTAVALGAGLAVWLLAPEMTLWMIPVLTGLILAIPLSVLLSSVPVGDFLASHQLLLTAQESATPQVLRRHRHLMSLPPTKEQTDPRGMFRRVLTDPALLTLHRSILEATDVAAPVEPRILVQTQRQLLAGGAARVSAQNRKAVLSDPAALAELHLFVWSKSAGLVAGAATVGGPHT